MTVQFVDAPPQSNRPEGGELQEWLGEVKKHPGKWAKRSYKTQSSASSTGTGVKALGFKATTRGADLYVSWPK